jgi:hypothetical protein
MVILTSIRNGAAMMVSNRDVLRLYKFMVSEVGNYSENIKHNSENGGEYDALHMMRDSCGRLRIVGASVDRELRRISDELLFESQLWGRVDPDRVYKIVREKFGKEYLRVLDREPSGSSIKTNIISWIELAGEECGKRTYFIPCNVGLKSGRLIHVGPVKIESRKTAFPRIIDEYQKCASVNKCDESHIASEATMSCEYYSYYRDIAEVSVCNCDGPTSRNIADSIVRSVMDFVHFLAGEMYTKDMNAGGPPTRDRRCEIFVNSGGEYSIGHNIKYGGALISDEWWGKLFLLPQNDFVISFGNVLSDRAACRELSMLGSRFLDGCSWFGDAARETLPESAIVKYVTAIERLLWVEGDSNSGVTNRIAQRAAAICSMNSSRKHSEMAKEVEVAYDARSGVVHGRIGKSDPKLRSLRRLCERVSRDLLHSWMYRFHTDFSSDLSNADFKQRISEFVQTSRAEP